MKDKLIQLKDGILELFFTLIPVFLICGIIFLFVYINSLEFECPICNETSKTKASRFCPLCDTRICELCYDEYIFFEDVMESKWFREELEKQGYRLIGGSDGIYSDALEILLEDREELMLQLSYCGYEVTEIDYD